MQYKYNVFTDNFDLISPDSAFPKYYIDSGVYVKVGSYGQYVIHYTGYLEVAGTIELETAAMIIIE